MAIYKSSSKLSTRDGNQGERMIIQLQEVYLEYNSRAEPDVTRNLQTVKLDNAGDWFEPSQEIGNI